MLRSREMGEAVRSEDLKALQKADRILAELVRKGHLLVDDSSIMVSSPFGCIRRLQGWTGTLLRHAELGATQRRCLEGPVTLRASDSLDLR